MAEKKFDNRLADYVDVAERIREFKQKHPDGSLQPTDPTEPIKVITIDGKTFLQYTAAAFRTPDDPTPGIGVAWEVFPGQTPYTKNSEAMNAETSAWGRAIVAALASETKKVASHDEVLLAQARQADPETVTKAADAIADQVRLEDADAAGLSQFWRDHIDLLDVIVEMDGGVSTTLRRVMMARRGK